MSIAYKLIDYINRNQLSFILEYTSIYGDNLRKNRFRLTVYNKGERKNLHHKNIERILERNGAEITSAADYEYKKIVIYFRYSDESMLEIFNIEQNEVDEYFSILEYVNFLFKNINKIYDEIYYVGANYISTSKI